MNITEITNNSEKQTITRLILEALPDWFGIPEAQEECFQRSRLLLSSGENRADGQIRRL